MNFEFLRIAPVNLLRYLPQKLTLDDIFKNTLDICSDQHEKMRRRLIDMAQQFFVKTATWGLTDWERVLAIPTVRADRYDIRRRRILLKLQGCQTSSVPFMDELINRYTTQKGYIVEHNEDYKFEVVVNIDSVDDWHALFEAVDTYKPAHLMMFMAIELFLRWEIRQHAECMQIVEAHHIPYNLGTAQRVRWDGKHRWNGKARWSGLHPDALYRTRQHMRQEAQGIARSHQTVEINQRIEAAGVAMARVQSGARKQYAIGTGMATSWQPVEMFQCSEATGIAAARINGTSDQRRANLWNGGFCWNGSHAWEGATVRTGYLTNLCTIIRTKFGRRVGVDRV